MCTKPRSVRTPTETGRNRPTFHPSKPHPSGFPQVAISKTAFDVAPFRTLLSFVHKREMPACGPTFAGLNKLPRMARGRFARHRARQTPAFRNTARTQHWHSRMTPFEKRDLLAFANPALGERPGRRELGRSRRVLASVHPRAVERNACDDVVEGVSVQGHVAPRDVFVLTLHPERVSKREAARRRYERMAFHNPHRAHKVFNGTSPTSHLPKVYPIVNVAESVRSTASEPGNFVVLGHPVRLCFQIGRNDLVLVHQLVEHRATSSSRMRCAFAIASSAHATATRTFVVTCRRLRLHLRRRQTGILPAMRVRRTVGLPAVQALRIGDMPSTRTLRTGFCQRRCSPRRHLQRESCFLRT